MELSIPTRDIVIGAIGSVVGAMVVATAAFGWRFIADQRAASRKRLADEREQWSGASPADRGVFISRYEFSVFSHFSSQTFFGSSLILSTVLPPRENKGMFSPFLPTG